MAFPKQDDLVMHTAALDVVDTKPPVVGVISTVDPSLVVNWNNGRTSAFAKANRLTEISYSAVKPEVQALLWSTVDPSGPNPGSRGRGVVIRLFVRDPSGKGIPYALVRTAADLYYTAPVESLKVNKSL